jgi:hypothetical protein
VKKWKLILWVALAIIIILQFFNPNRTNPPVKNDFFAALKPPQQINAAIRAACYDCHSHETVWPWYARIAPASWLVAYDVNEGREHFNLSDWPTEASRAAKKLDRFNEVLEYREMPPKKYTALHAEARLTEAQRKEIMDWTEAAADKLRAADQ